MARVGGKKGKTGTKTKPGTKPGTKVIRVVNPAKKDDKDARKQQAAERLSNALKRIENADKMKAENMARKAELEKRLQEQPEAEQQTTKTELEALDQEMTDANLEIERAKEEESLAEKEQKDIDMEDVTEEQVVNDPDNPKPTTEGSNPGGPSKKKKKNQSREDDDESNDDDGDDDDDSDEEDDDTEEEEDAYPDLINHDEIRKGLGMTRGVCKGWTKVGSHGKRPVVQLGPNSSPTFRTMKSRQFDGFVDPSSKYNLVKHRRCDVRNEDDTKKFTMDDVVGIQGVSYYVEDDYEGNPAEKLKPLPPKLTKKQKDALKARGEAIPEEPRPETVQVLLKWKRKYQGKWRSFETRSGIRGLYGDDARGDKFIYKAALEQEEKYQEYLKGQRPADSRSVSPFAPGNEKTPPPVGGNGTTSAGQGLPTPPGGTPAPAGQNGNTSTGQAVVTPPGGTPPPGGQTGSSKAAKKAAMDEFKEDYLLGAGVDEWKELTPQQQSDGIKAFRLFWAKKQVAG